MTTIKSCDRFFTNPDACPRTRRLYQRTNVLCRPLSYTRVTPHAFKEMNVTRPIRLGPYQLICVVRAFIPYQLGSRVRSLLLGAAASQAPAAKATRDFLRARPAYRQRPAVSPDAVKQHVLRWHSTQTGCFRDPHCPGAADLSRPAPHPPICLFVKGTRTLCEMATPLCHTSVTLM